ncbi:TIGR03767 family metallophosphoesterase [Mycobacterium sp.]|uniref:TIGR03767 family metallophosphoesterase n=1 Tax=Mycobacterium sp. TaxID=1785 RepID=UPI003BAAAC91
MRMLPLSRRRFLLAAAATAAAATCTPWSAEAAPAGQQIALIGKGTTLESVSTPGPPREGGYRPLVVGAPWPLYVRQELATAGAARENLRTPIADFVQMTDTHIVDAQCPARFEYIHPLLPSQTHGAFRPHETLTTQGLVSLVRRINSLRSGPFTGRPFDCVICTGDNTDNRETVELDWFLTALSGGSITANTGAPARYGFEGLQAHGSYEYWQPESPFFDRYKRSGFVQIPGFLDAAMKEHVSPGLQVPWYSVLGNHDDNMLGTVPNIVDWLYLAPFKLDLPHTDPAALAIFHALTKEPESLAPILSRLRVSGPIIPATPDPRRAPFSKQKFVSKHFDSAILGPGPSGHGFTSPDGPTWYVFQIAPGLTGISLDTTNNLGFSSGSIGQRQLDWMTKQIASRPDQLIIVFSHHTSKTMTAKLPNTEDLGDKQFDGTAVVSVLNTYTNVIAWVNGHTHQNTMFAHPGETPKHSFWEINTASHIDYPQLARIIEVADNRDGTLSIFTPLIEAESPVAADPSDLTAVGLASLYRELSYNDIYRNPEFLGVPRDRNCELLLAHPFS